MAERLYIQNRKRRMRRQERLRMLWKLLLIVIGSAFFLFLAGRTVVRIVSPPDARESMTLQEAGNLAWLLADTAGADAEGLLASLKEMDASRTKGYLTYGQAQCMLDFLPEETGLLSDAAHQEEDLVLKEDWYAWFDAARARLDPDGQIRDISLRVLAAGAQVRRGDGTGLSSQQLMSTEGAWNFYAPAFGQEAVCGRQLTAVGRDDGLYAIRSMEAEDRFTIYNAWVTEADSETVSFFWNDYEICLSSEADGTETGRRIDSGLLAGETKRDVVGDITFSGKDIVEIAYKENKVSGRLLKVADGGAEIEGQGFFPFSGQLKLYRLYGRMQELKTEDLRIGYAFTDFVVENGVIEAALVPKEEKMENIRVLIKTSGYGSAYHDTVTLQADCDCRILYGAFDNVKEQTLSAGEQLTVTKDSGLFEEGDRIRIEPAVLTGRISLINVDRAQGIPSYRGSFELVSTRDGILAVNEVLLEEYLYAVVPSEMPASYPMEALKSQAICARTYAYAKMCHAGLAAYGAHVDDSTGFQVYQNIGENAESTRAVRETKGQTLFWGEEAAQVYYYSTSCGYGTDAGIWSNGDSAAFPYLVSGQIGEGDHFFEEQEPWYRWQYTAEDLDAERLMQAVSARYQANPDSVLTRLRDGTYTSQKPPQIGRIKELSVVRYHTGGVAQELEIEGEQGTVLVLSEYNIRSVLCDGETQVLRQDGSYGNAASLLPSGFFTLETFKEDGFVVGYTLSGGGYGHGVGMSQNGAKNMALSGYPSEAILDFFYPGCTITDIYEEKE